MMKIRMLVTMGMLMTTWAWAVPMRTYTPPQIQEDIPTIEYRGKVVSLLAADPSKGVRAEIVVAPSSGEPWHFLVSDAALIKDQSGEEVALSEVKPGDEVVLNYVIYFNSPNKAKIYEAQSIAIQ